MMAAQALSAEETLDILQQAIEKRRSYLKHHIDIKMKESTKGRHREMYRGGMLNEIHTIKGLLEEIKQGSINIDEIWNIEGAD